MLWCINCPECELNCEAICVWLVSKWKIHHLQFVMSFWIIRCSQLIIIWLLVYDRYIFKSCEQFLHVMLQLLFGWMHFQLPLHLTFFPKICVSLRRRVLTGNDERTDKTILIKQLKSLIFSLVCGILFSFSPFKLIETDIYRFINKKNIDLHRRLKCS